MLRSNNRQLLILAIGAVLLYGCTGERVKSSVQKGSADSLTYVSVAETTQAPPDAVQDSFNVSIEGYKSTALGQAVHAGDTAQVRKLVSQGASVDRCLTDETYVFDIFYAASVFNKTGVLRYALKNELFTSVNKTYTEEAETPLTLACNLPDSGESLEIARSLIGLGAHVDGAGESGGEQTQYPLLIAVSRHNFGLTKLLLDHGANKDVKNEQGETPLVIAQKNGFEAIASLLKGN